MKKILSFLIAFTLAFSVMGQCPSLSTNNPSVSCTSPYATITATISNDLYSTNTYSVSSTAYTPYSYVTGTTIGTGTDDVYSSIIPLPFNFCFFGNTYNSIVIGSNGNISFNTSLAGAFDPWSISGPLPGSNCNATYNAIMSPWEDIYPPSGGSIRYNTYGTYPCRDFVISYSNLTMFLPSTCPGNTATQQIVLHETTNIIDIFIQNRTACLGWNSGRGVVGIENAAGTLFYTAPGQNGTAFSCTNTGWRFSPNGPTSPWTYTWTGPSGIIGTGPSVSVNPTVTTTYTVNATSTVCSGITITATSTVANTYTLAPISGPNQVCVGDSISLYNPIFGGNWSSSNPIIASVNSSGVTFGSVAGTAIISYALSSTCVSTYPIIVNPIYHTYLTDSMCQGDTYTFLGTSLTDTGVYNLAMYSMYGCDSLITLHLHSRQKPTANFYIKDYVCVGDTTTVALIYHSPDAIDYWWGFNGGVVTALSSDHGGPYQIFYPTVGLTTISLVAYNTLCHSDTVKDTVLVASIPDSKIAPITDHPCFGDSVFFKPLNWQPYNFYMWSPHHYFTIRDQRNVYGVIDSSGFIYLTVTNPYGCNSTDSIYVDAHPCCFVELPTAFTPNEDGLNDVFRPIGGRYFVQRFAIFNRWGQLVFETSQFGVGWNGKFGGTPQDMGTYFYSLDYECDGKRKNMSGDFILIR